MRLPIIKDILEKITVDEPANIDKLNIDTVFKVVWADFLYLREITYINTEFKKTLFSSTKVTRSNISFAEGSQYIVLWLKQNKTNTKHTKIPTILAVIDKKRCPVVALTRFYTLDL